jgi:hypothetical protein
MKMMTTSGRLFFLGPAQKNWNATVFVLLSYFYEDLRLVVLKLVFLFQKKFG